jgi:O-antigen ligase
MKMGRIEGFLYNKTKSLLVAIREMGKADVLMLILCLLLVAMVIYATNKNLGWYKNAVLTAWLEMGFLASYFVILRDRPRLFSMAKEYPAVAIIILLWLISISLSVLLSPLEPEAPDFVWGRYYQTVLHFVFFLFLLDFFRRYSPDFSWLYWAVAFSTMYVIWEFYSSYQWSGKYWLGNKDWLLHPPLNSNIRHTGYQALAAISFFTFFILSPSVERVVNVRHIAVMSILVAFLFWMGGRGSILSFLIMASVVCWVLVVKGFRPKFYLASLLISVVIGFLVAELFTVFTWNGIINLISKMFEKTAGLISGQPSMRIQIWLTTLESFMGSPALGLGSQGYYFMENRIGWFVHPHNSVLQFLIEWGVIGTLLFLALIFKALFFGFRNLLTLQKSPLLQHVITAGAVIISLSAHSVVDGTYFHPQPSAYLAIAYAIWVSSAMRKSAPGNSPLNAKPG